MRNDVVDHLDLSIDTDLWRQSGNIHLHGVLTKMAKYSAMCKANSLPQLGSSQSPCITPGSRCAPRNSALETGNVALGPVDLD
jgi:hypothetical protein